MASDGLPAFVGGRARSTVVVRTATYRRPPSPARVLGRLFLSEAARRASWAERSMTAGRSFRFFGTTDQPPPWVPFGLRRVAMPERMTAVAPRAGDPSRPGVAPSGGS